MEVRPRLTPREGRRFAFTVGIAFLVLGAIMVWRGHEILRWTFWGIGAALMVSGMVVPGRLGGIYRGWMRLGALISRVTSPILMGAVYFLVVTPIGGVSRVFGRNSLCHREHEGGFWLPAASGEPSDLENQF